MSQQSLLARPGDMSHHVLAELTAQSRQVHTVKEDVDGLKQAQAHTAQGLTYLATVGYIEYPAWCWPLFPAMLSCALCIAAPACMLTACQLRVHVCLCGACLHLAADVLLQAPVCCIHAVLRDAAYL